MGTRQGSLAATGIALFLILQNGVAADTKPVARASTPVFVDNGSGFQLVHAGAPIALNGRIMAVSQPAVLSDAIGCTVSVTPGSMLALGGGSLCAASMRAAAQNTQPRQPPDPSDWIWIPIAGGVLAAFILLPDGNKKKVSP